MDINGCFAEDAQTNRTLENIKVALQERLKTYNIDDINKVNKILKIHGLSKGDFDFVKNIENFINNKLNDISIDSNSNKNEKTIEGIFNELTSPVKKAVGYDMLYRMMKRLYGQDEAKRLSGLMYDFTLAMADSTNINRFYCYSVDASKLITEGRPFGQLHSKPAKRMDSYISALCETIHQLSNHAAGAIAVGSFFFDIAHLLLFKEEITLKQLIEDKKTRKYVENEYQTLTHSLNHLSRSSNESCFTNISVFDRSKIKYLLKEMPHLFNVTLMSKKTAEQVYEAMDVVDEAGAENSISFEDYLVEYIIRLEDLFLDFFDKGDPTKNGIPYRFPIISINISKNKKNEILDKEFLNDFVQKDVYRYNIFTSEGMKLASCCRLENNIEMLKLGNNVNSFGGVGIGIGCYDEKTEVMTNSGWKFFKDLNKDIDKILTVNKETKKLEYQNYTDYFEKYYEGEMHHYKQNKFKNLDLLITPNHNMLVSKDYNSEVWMLKQSKDIKSKVSLPRITSGYDQYNDNFINFNGKNYDLTIFCELIGFFIGDGTLYLDSLEAKKRAYELSFILKRQNKILYLEKLLKDLSIDYKKYFIKTRKTYCFRFYNKEMYLFFRKFYNSDNKKIIMRDFFNKLSLEQNKGLLQGLLNSDGHVKNNCATFYTSSEELKNNVEEVILKIGYSFRTSFRQRNIFFKKENKNIISNSYEIYIQKENFIHNLNVKKETIFYKGKIYCVTVPNHTMFVKRNNCVSISGNSHRVVTLNLNRIANLSNTEGIFFSDVALYVKDIAKILKAHKELILLEKDKGLQLFISNGWINMNRMFSTVGIIGAVEMNETLQKKFNTQTDYIEETLKLIEDNTKHLSEEFGLFINIEQIPGETMAAKLVSVDKILLGEENIPYKLYANQFIPLWKEASLYERLAIDGKYNKLLTGGGIVHAQIGEKVTSNQAEQIIKYAIKCGCEHFALNAIYCKCKQDHTSFGKLELCPICGEKNLEYYTRVVGFFTPVSDWNSVRRDWEFDERKFVDLKEIK